MRQGKLSNREEIKVRQYEAQINKYDQQRGNAPRFLLLTNDPPVILLEV